jgi:hypothetical protein
MSALGHKRTNHLGPKPCTLLSESRQTRVRLLCPLSANSAHRDVLDKIRPLGGRHICASAQCSYVDDGFLVVRRR